MSAKIIPLNTHPKRLIRINDAARILACSRSLIYSLMESKQLRYVKLGRSRRIPLTEVYDFIDRNLERSVPTDPEEEGDPSQSTPGNTYQPVWAEWHPSATVSTLRFGVEPPQL